MSDDERFDRFLIGRRLGGGGMGVVHEAYDERLRRHVALKRIRGELADDPETVARFEQECAIAARLRDPHVVQVYDYGTFEGSLFVVTQLIDGGTLKDLLRNGPLAVPIVADLVAQIASGLSTVHAESVVHRDVKPANILIAETGHGQSGLHAYVADFGIARALDASSRITETARAAPATPSYASPEAITGEGISTASDVYSLSCVLYEMLVGTVPFDGDPRSVAYRHLSLERPVPGATDRDLAAFDSVIRRGMAIAPGERYAGVRELAEACTRAAGQSVHGATTVPGRGTPGEQTPDRVTDAADTLDLTSPPPAERRRRRPVALALGVALTVVVAATVAGLTWWLSGNDPVAAPDESLGRTPSVASTSVPGTPAQTTATTRSTSVPDPIAVGTCLDIDRRAVSCYADHLAQVYATGSQCSSSEALAFLGGQNGIDVLLPSVQSKTQQVLGRQVCTVVDGQTLHHGSAANVLQSAGGAAWRRCVSADQATIACNRLHIGEYVFAGSDSSRKVDCEDKASLYIGSAFADLSSELRCVRSATGTTVACAVFLRTDNRLTTTVRRLGKRALPIR